jgi:hypothetical protein
VEAPRAPLRRPYVPDPRGDVGRERVETGLDDPAFGLVKSGGFENRPQGGVDGLEIRSRARDSVAADREEDCTDA